VQVTISSDRAIKRDREMSGVIILETGRACLEPPAVTADAYI